MNLKGYIILIISSLLISSNANAAYNDAGTDYSKQGSEKWVQDSAADSLKMINAFVCIASNSGGDTRPNATWRALIDELKCGLKSADEGGAGALSLADVTMTSTRASDTSDQEMNAYFSSTSGANYITDMTFNVNTNSAFGMTMDFRWYQSSDNTTPVNQSTMANGFSDISVNDNNSDGNLDTVILHTEFMPAGGGNPLFRSGAYAVTYGPDNKVTKFISSLLDDEYNSLAYYQGETNTTHYRRKMIAGDGVTVLNDRCYERGSEWANTYDYGMYDNVTGAEIDISGSFGFTYSGGTKRGFMGYWGVWMDGPDTDYPTAAQTVGIKQQDTDVNMTLKAAPGRLTKVSKENYTIVEGEAFRAYDGNREKNVYYDSDCGTSKFSTSDSGCSEFTFHANYWKVQQNGANNKLGAGDWLHSEVANGSVVLRAIPNAFLFKREEVGPTHTFASSDKALTCVGGCPKGKPTKAQYDAWNATDYCRAPFNTAWNNGGGSCTYTFKSSSDANNPLTMFKGSNPVVLYKDASTVMTPADANGGHYHIGGGRYILTSDIGGTCAAEESPSETNNIWNCTNGVYEWSTGLERWNQSYYAVYDNNSFVTIEKPITVEYTFATADDQNTAFTQASPFSYIWKRESVDGSGYRIRGAYDNVSATTYPSQFNGKKFILEYEGKGQLWGFPERRTENNWLRLINPKNGIQVTRADNSSQGYVLKAKGTGMMYSQVANSNCASMMSVSSMANFTVSNIPKEDDRTSSTKVWGNRPTVNTISVKHGVDQ